MKQSTFDEIVLWRAVPLFSNCGKFDIQIENATRTTRLEAINSLSDAYGKWSAHGLMLNGRTNTIVHRLNYHRACNWNTVALEVDAICAEIAKNGISRIEFPSDDQIFLSIKAMLGGALMELEFEDITPSVFYRSRLRNILLSGYLPCGWTGIKLDTYWAGASEDPVPDGEILYY